MNNYLWDFAQKLPCENKFQAVLKSALLIKALRASETSNTYNKWMCRKCKTLWKFGYFKAAILPADENCRKQMLKYESKPNLSKKELSLFRYLQTRTAPLLKYTCQICSYKTRVSVPPPPAVRSSKPTTTTRTTQKLPEKKTKKRKRDQDAGLLIPASMRKPAPKSLPTSNNNRFTENDFSKIVKLLQEKSKKPPPPNGKTVTLKTFQRKAPPKATVAQRR